MITTHTGRSLAPRLAAALAAGAGVLAFAAGPAAAQTTTTQSCYPLAECAVDSLTVSDETLDPGQSFTVTARGFRPGTTVTFTVDGQVLGTAVADEQGVATATLTLPAGIGPGRHTLLATGTGADGQPLVVSQILSVNGATRTPVGVVTPGASTRAPATGSTPSSSSRGRLARTGSTVVPAAVAGVGLVLAGSAVARAAKKKKTATT